jgi:hypothetical protein
MHKPSSSVGLAEDCNSERSCPMEKEETKPFTNANLESIAPELKCAICNVPYVVIDSLVSLWLL